MLHKIKYKIGLLLVIGLGVSCITNSCSKSKDLAEDPYAGGKQVLDIQFISKTTDPDIVNAGAALELKVNGLLKYKDQFKVFVNELEAEVLSYTDSTLNFVVPAMSSTGSIWVTANEQSFFGPVIKIGGKVSVDVSFKAVNGTTRLGTGGDASIYDIIQLPNNKFWLVGAFDSFELKATEEKPKAGIVQMGPEGAYDDDYMRFGIGAFGASKTIYSINRINTGSYNGKFIVAGNFSAYDSKRPTRQTINNITRLNDNGSLDTMRTLDIVNPTPEKVWKNADTIPAFNGGVDGVVRKTFIFGEKLYVIGNFQNYKRIYYPNSSYDDKVYDVTRMLQIAKLNLDGSMDSTYHFNPAKGQSETAGNGSINDAMMQSDGKLILVGNFTSFNGIACNRIVRLNLDGSVDQSFNIGQGSDGDINSIRYNEVTKKIVLSGLFNSFNGKSANAVIVLNSDGTLDDTFISEKITGGAVTFAAQLNSGKIIVSGSFNRYGDYLRQGFMILEANGKLASGYNNTGGFKGRIYDMIETEMANESKVILVGSISRFNSTLPGNILRLLIKK
ncbi:DUF5008 domain-containing protein [Sphingobacterium faecium]|jgi:hypothetical protein|uniref:DUF5008 domain-containing protein n=1 Tax=Sphingobacterium faecium TaxID=34087 RepID=UPI00320919CA